MTVQPGDVLELSARMEFNVTEDVVNVYQTQHSGVTPVSDSNAVSDVLTWLETIYNIVKTFQSVLMLYRDIRIANKTQDTVLGVFSWPTITAGLDASDPNPPGVAMLLDFPTAVSRVIPRKYIGVLTEPSIDPDATWSVASLVVGTSVAGQILAPYVGIATDWQYGYLSPKTASFEIPVSSSVSVIPAYQRRRKQGRGS